jgi:MFS family permease
LFVRFLQGIAAALVISCAPVLVTGLYTEAQRSRALGIFTLIFALGSASGPLIGGALVARWGWPAVFWFRAPIALTSLIFLRGLPRRAIPAGERRFDIPGALLLAVGLAALLLSLNAIARLGQGNYAGLLLLSAAVASFVAFVWWEDRTAQPIVRIELFRRASFTLINLSSVLMYLVTFAVMLFAPYFLRDHTTLPVAAAGFVLASGFIAMAALSPLAGFVVGRLGTHRIAPLGGVAAGAGLFLVGFWRPDSTAAFMVATLALQGVGMALFQVAYIELVMAASPAAHHGVAGSLSMLTRTTGVVIAAALLTLAFHGVESTVRAAGAAPAVAFLDAYRTIFRGAGIIAMLTGGLVGWSARRLARERCQAGV